MWLRLGTMAARSKTGRRVIAVVVGGVAVLVAYAIWLFVVLPVQLLTSQPPQDPCAAQMATEYDPMTGLPIQPMPAPAASTPAAGAPPAAFTIVPTQGYREGQSSPQAQKITIDAARLRNFAIVAKVAGELWPNDPARRDRAILIATITMLVETTGTNDASRAVPETLQYPHDGVSEDHDSAGLFQQRVREGYHGTAAQIMDPIYATRMFFGHPLPGAPKDHDWGLDDYQRIKGKDWMAVEPGDVAADIQRPREDLRYRYSLWVEPGRRVIQSAAGIAVSSGTDGGCQDQSPAPGGGPAVPGAANGANDYEPFRQGKEGVDPWSFYWGECVSFTAWKVRTTSKYKDFTNNWTLNGRSAHFGNAKEWEAAGRQVGLQVDETPAAGAIAVRRSGSAGHVAFVSAVHPDGKIDIAEYNHAGHHIYSERKNVDWRRGGSDGFDVFVHFEK